MFFKKLKQIKLKSFIKLYFFAFLFLGIVLILITVIIFLALPKNKELNIKTAIKKANYCEIDSDCVDAGGKCPFGCYIYVNKNEVEKISKLIDSYESECIYDCVSNSKVVCENKKCKELFIIETVAEYPIWLKN